VAPAFGVGASVRKDTYSAGAGLGRAALVARDDELPDWSVALQRVENGRPAQSVVLHGPHGAGRTVLLGASHRRAEDRHWMTVIINANAGSPFWGTLSCALYPLVRELVQPRAGDELVKALATFELFSVKVEVAGEWPFGFDVAGRTVARRFGENERWVTVAVFGLPWTMAQGAVADDTSR